MPEDTRRPPLLTIVLVALLGAGATLWYLYFMADRNVEVAPSETEMLPPETSGLDEEPVEPISLTGNLYFTAPSAFYPVNELASYSQQLVLGAEQADLVSFTPLRDYNPIDATRGLALLAAAGGFGSEDWQPVLFDRDKEESTALSRVDGHWINDLQMSPDGTRYAYNYVAEVAPSPNLRTIADWHIAIHDLNSDVVLDIPAAAEPTWINDGADLLYLSQAGIFRYNLATQESTRVFADYLPFNYFDDMAAAPDSSAVVLTVPFIRERTMVVVLQVGTDGVLTETSRLVSNDTKRRSPVFSPDSQYYAVMAAKETRSDGSANVPETERMIEIRDLNHVQPVATIELGGSGEPLELEVWTLLE